MPKGNRNVIVVGAGLFGSMAATMARKRGFPVTVIDNREALSASKASGCVLAPSWLTSLNKEQSEKAVSVLKSLYFVQDLAFRTAGAKLFRAQAVHPDSILVKPDIVGEVVEVGDGYAGVQTKEGGQYLKGVVLVAAGIWTEKLIDMPKIRGLYGASLRLWGVRIQEPLLQVYAPYRQAVAYTMAGNKETWFGDGTALSEATWTKERSERIAKLVERAANMGIGCPGNRIKVREGARPYVEGFKSGYFARAGKNLWVSTGGAKNGVVLAAWQGYRFTEEAL